MFTWTDVSSLYLSQFKPSTRSAYEIGITQFNKWCAEQQLDPLHASRAHLQAYLAFLLAKNYATSTVQLRFSAVFGAYKLAVEEDYLDKSPAAKVVVPRIDRAAQRRTVLSPLEFAAFLRASESMGPVEHGIAALGGMLGLRSAEMTNIEATDISVVRGYVALTIVGKGNKTHLIPLPVPVMRPVSELAALYPTGKLLRTKAHMAMDRRSLNRYVKRIAQRAGISREITSHGLRRTYATSGFMKGVSLRDMQIAMRHARPDTTLLYDLDRQNLDRHASHEIAAFLSGFSV